MNRLVDVQVEGGVLQLRLDHPPLNILTRAVCEALRAGLAQAHEDPIVRVAVLAAAGKHFSAGADVGEHLPPTFEAMIPEFLETIRAVEDCPVPVIAAVRGRCLGGGFELVQAADIVVAAEGAVFGQPEIVLGVIAPAACLLLRERCAHGDAAEVLFTGDPITATDAQRIGLVQRVVPDQQVEAVAHAVAARISRHSGAAVRLTKQALMETRRPGRQALFDALGRLYTEELMQTTDAVEGLRAFQEKRDPKWSHA